jgi:pimeloyl-ACP methyl ester carboxylesterase
LAVAVAGPDLTAPLVRPALGAEISAEPAAEPQAEPQAIAPARVHPGADLKIDEFSVHIPAGAVEPLTVLVALHGMGGNGEDFARPLIPWTDVQHWVVVAPTYTYGDWGDPAQLTREATTQLPRIAAFLDRMPDIAGMSVRSQAVVYGFSRGGQTANRFALAYPEHVAAVAMVSAGTYTLPFSSLRVADADVAMPYPFGVANCSDLFGSSFNASAFSKVPFWVAVGARDSDPTDVPHQWDRFLGDDRLERAERFTGLLRDAGVSAQVHVFADVGHGETDTMRSSAIDFLRVAAS